MTERPKDDLTRAERIFVRINVAQTILAVAGVFTGAVALYAALNESAAVRRQSAAAVWPLVELNTTDYVTNDGALFQLSVRNAGVGPARIKAMKVSLEGKPVANWTEFSERALGGANVVLGRITAVGRVLRPGDQVNLFTVSEPAAVRKLTELAYSGAASVEYCYCSIFDECWFVKTIEEWSEPRPTRVCPDYGKEAFQE